MTRIVQLQRFVWCISIIEHIHPVFHGKGIIPVFVCIRNRVISSIFSVYSHAFIYSIVFQRIRHHSSPADNNTQTHVNDRFQKNKFIYKNTAAAIVTGMWNSHGVYYTVQSKSDSRNYTLLYVKKRNLKNDTLYYY